MPLNIDLMQILLHMLNFVILFGALTLLVYKPVNKFLNERKAHFEELESKAQEKVAENEKLNAEYKEVLEDAKQKQAELLKKSEKETAEAAKAYLDNAREKAQAIISEAEHEAELRKEHIIDSAQAEIGELVVSAAQKLLSDTVTPERDSAMYDEFIRLTDKAVADKRALK